MSGVLERAFQVLEYLSERPAGSPISALAGELDIPLSASHRVLADLVRCGYVRQDAETGRYALTIKMVAMGLSFLSRSGVVDVSQPLLDQLASHSGELVRLAIVDGESLVFVAKAQGATHGLRYDPDMGLAVPLWCSAAGHAWLSTLTDDDALVLVARAGLNEPERFGPRAPTSIGVVMDYVRAARERGFSMITEVFAPGMAAMAAPVRGDDGAAIGVVTIAGPAVRLTESRMQELAPDLLETARLVASASGASALFKRKPAATV
ncbi:MAG: IclR family transcriptional regulator [Rhodocyclaceae bacterium]